MPDLDPSVVERLEADCAEAERAFARKPDAEWTARTYLAPKSARAVRALLSHATVTAPLGKTKAAYRRAADAHADVLRRAQAAETALAEANAEAVLSMAEIARLRADLDEARERIGRLEDTLQFSADYLNDTLNIGLVRRKIRAALAPEAGK